MKKLISLLLSLVLLCSVCSFAMAEEVPEGYPALIKDADGKVVDLGGMEIIVTDWWSAADGTPQEATSAAAEAQLEYRDWAMKTYNFKMIQKSDGDWAANPQSLLDFINTQGEENRVMIMRSDSVANAMAGGLLYNMASLDCLDFTAEKWNKAVINSMSTAEGAVYGASTGSTEPREVVFFNKRLVEEAGIDPESIYDLQKNNEWTFAKFEEMLAKCTRDTDNDGVNDTYGMASDNDSLQRVAIPSNNGKLFDLVEGKYVCTAQSEEVLEALNWAQSIIVNYAMPQPADSNWDWYFEAFKSGMAAFHVGKSYEVNPGSNLSGMSDDYGMVAFPTGPKNEAGHYVNVMDENVTVMPGFYDAERAWKIAFAWNIWTDETPGYEAALDPEAWKATHYPDFRDDRAVDETYAMLRDPAHIVSIPRFAQDNDVLGQDFFWDLAGGAVTVQEAIEKKMPAWQAYIDTANGVGK